MDFVRFHRRRHGRPHLESDNLRGGSESCFLGFISSHTRVRISYKKTVRFIVRNLAGQRKSPAGNRSVIPAGDFHKIVNIPKGMFHAACFYCAATPFSGGGCCCCCASAVCCAARAAACCWARISRWIISLRCCSWMASHPGTAKNSAL